jgi:hypothetical protein
LVKLNVYIRITYCICRTPTKNLLPPSPRHSLELRAQPQMPPPSRPHRSAERSVRLKITYLLSLNSDSSGATQLRSTGGDGITLLRGSNPSGSARNFQRRSGACPAENIFRKPIPKTMPANETLHQFITTVSVNNKS